MKMSALDWWYEGHWDLVYIVGSIIIMTVSIGILNWRERVRDYEKDLTFISYVKRRVKAAIEYIKRPFGFRWWR